MGFFDKIGEWFESTHIDEQLRSVDYVGLFTNPWFMVPFVALVAWMLYKQRWTRIIVIGIGFGAWYFSGTEYAKTLVVYGELDMYKILPVMFGGAVALGLVVYLLFGSSD